METARDADADPEALFVEFLQGVEADMQDDVIVDAHFRDILRTLGCYDGMVRGHKEPELAKTMDLLGRLGRWVQTHEVQVEEDPMAYGGYDVSLVTQPGGSRLKVVPVSGFSEALAEVCERVERSEEVPREVKNSYYGIPTVVVSKYLDLFPLQQTKAAPPPGPKLCSQCKVEKPPTDFYRRSPNQTCKPCSGYSNAPLEIGPSASQKVTSSVDGRGDAENSAQGYKVCSMCKVSKDFASFSKDKSKPLGIRSRCHECEKVAWKKRGGANSRRMCLNCGEQKEIASFGMDGLRSSRICKACSTRKQLETRQYQGPSHSAQAMCAACLKLKSMDDFIGDTGHQPFVHSRCRECVKKNQPVSSKHCARCNLDMPMSEFAPDRYNRSGFAAHCKSCSTTKRPSRERKHASDIGLDGSAKEEAGLGNGSGGRGGRMTRSSALHERCCTNCGLVKSGDSFQPKGGDLPGQLGWCNVCYEFDGVLAKKDVSAHRAERDDSAEQCKKCSKCGMTKGMCLFPKEVQGCKPLCSECLRKSFQMVGGQLAEGEKDPDPADTGRKDPVAFLSGLFDSAQRTKGGQKRGASLADTSVLKGSGSLSENIGAAGKSSAQGKSMGHDDRKRGLVRNESGLLVKFCSGCKLLRGADMYRKDKSKGTGLRSRCRVCEGTSSIKKDPDGGKSKKAKKGGQLEGTRDELALVAPSTSLNLAPAPDVGMPQEKICTCCRMIKTWAEFNKDNSKSSKLSSWCKLCTNSRVRSGRIRHRPSQRSSRPGITPTPSQRPQNNNSKLKPNDATDLFQWETEQSDGGTSEAGADVTSPDSDCCLGLSPLSIQRCSKCGKDKATMEFYPNPGVPSGMFAWCKECCKVLDLMPNKKRKKSARRLPRRRCVRCGELRTSLSFIKSIKFPNRVNVVCRHCNKVTRETRAAAKKRRVKQGETELEFRLLVHEWKGLGRGMADPGGGELLWSELQELSSAESSPEVRGQKPFSDVTLPPYTRRKRRKISVDPMHRAIILSNAQKEGDARGQADPVPNGERGTEANGGTSRALVVHGERNAGKGPAIPPTTLQGAIKVAEKQCMSCGVTKDAASFHRNRSSKSGLASWCIQCKRRGGKPNSKNTRSSTGAKERSARDNEAVEPPPVMPSGSRPMEGTGFASDQNGDDEPPAADFASVGNHKDTIKRIVSIPMDDNHPDQPGNSLLQEASVGVQQGASPSAPLDDRPLENGAENGVAEVTLTRDQIATNSTGNNDRDDPGNEFNNGADAIGHPQGHGNDEQGGASSNPPSHPTAGTPDEMNIDTEGERLVASEPQDVEMVDAAEEDAGQGSPSSDVRQVDSLPLNRLVFDEEEDREEGNSDLDQASGDSSHDVDGGRNSGQSGSLSDGDHVNGGNGGGEEEGEFPNSPPQQEANLIDLNSDDDALGDDHPNEESEPSHDMLFVGERVENVAEVELPVAVGNAVNPMSDSFEESDESGSDNGGDRDSGEVDRWSLGGGRR